jgi:hypothetical protein
MIINPLYSRASNATVINNNKIVDVNSGVQRYQRGKFGYALLTEGASTNLLYNSSFESGDATNWTASTGITTSITTTSIHRTYGMSLSNSGATTQRFFQSQTLGLNTYCLSAYVKASDGVIPDSTVCQLYSATTSGGTALTTIVEYAFSGWYRLSAIFNGSATTYYNGIIVNSGKTVTVDAFQLESGFEFPTSYIYTITGATASRSADALSYSLSSSTFSVNAIESGSISIWIKPDFYSTISSTKIITFVEIGTGDTTSYKLQYDCNEEQFIFLCKNSSYSYLSVPFSKNEFIHLCATWTGTTSSIYVNSVKGTDDNTFSILTTHPQKVYVGQANGIENFYGLIDDLVIL